MKARDVMVAPVITVPPSASVKDAARLFLEHRISAVPVVDEQGRMVGIVSEGDLLRRAEIGTERRRSWWLTMIAEGPTLAADYVKSHARRVADVMTPNVLAATPDTPLQEVATTMERNAIKRVPIVSGGRLVGIVSRANLVQAFVTSGATLDIPLSDSAIRDKLTAYLKKQPWADSALLNATVNDGVVDLWGISGSDAERKAIRVAAEAMPGVRAVNDHMAIRPLHYAS